MAAKTGLLRIVDRNFGGLAKGVGVARILGRIHITTVKIGNCVLPCSISVIDSDGVDFLLGLDMLKRHLIEIDLRKKVLRIGNEEIGFVPKEQNEDRSEILRSVERMGFSREKAEHALETTGWDIDAAIQLLTQ
ncbi:hypothetical protein MHBO_003600 [Bonamia ostreae]|uniref:UBA domain-containing protein n=1 Tax=Bonamia ostreae TaxID=126728 RepID=A0ABV2AQY0_9EUKA